MLDDTSHICSGQCWSAQVNESKALQIPEAQKGMGLLWPGVFA